MDRVIVVGGGVIGLLSAYFLAREGISIVLLEQASVGRESSWAGGGIVSPLYPWRYSAAVSALAHWSQDFYPELGRHLLAQTGLDPEVYETGLYWFDLDDHEQALEWAQRQGRTLLEVDSVEAYAKVAPLGSGFKRALYMPDVANVRNPRLAKSLRKALDLMPNVTIKEHLPVTGFALDKGRVVGVVTEQGELLADQVVVAAGAWTGELLKTLALELPVEPVKGQMILYKCAPDFLKSMVLAGGRYAIPRRDGHILIGSTLEYTGFAKQTTDDALQSLRASAMQLLPELAKAEVVGHWAGLRPGSPKGIPYIGPVPNYPGLWLNCGHFRNGLVLAPASCRLLSDLMAGREPIIDPSPYAPARLLSEMPLTTP